MKHGSLLILDKRKISNRFCFLIFQPSWFYTMIRLYARLLLLLVQLCLQIHFHTPFNCHITLFLLFSRLDDDAAYCFIHIKYLESQTTFSFIFRRFSSSFWETLECQWKLNSTTFQNDAFDFLLKKVRSWLCGEFSEEMTYILQQWRTFLAQKLFSFPYLNSVTDLCCMYFE